MVSILTCMSLRSNKHSWRRKKHVWVVTFVILVVIVVGATSVLFHVQQEHVLKGFGTSVTHKNAGSSKTVFQFTPKNITLYELLTKQFPQCAILLPASTVNSDKTHRRGINNNNNMTLVDQWISWLNRTNNVTDRGQYVKTSRLPRYDHISCYIMKARYNCAIPPLFLINTSMHNTTTKAFQYQFQWTHPEYDHPCDLNEFLSFVGGPVGVDSFIRPSNWIIKNKATGHHKLNNDRPYEVMLQGNSYLRQIWEALVCGFRHQITNLTLVQGGPMLSLAYIQSRSGKLITPQELGRFLPGQEDAAQQYGCHGVGGKNPIANYYWNTAQPKYFKRFPFHEVINYDDDDDKTNVTVPPSVPKCKDDMAMVEFGNAIRFYFIFHPSRYNEYALSAAYDRMGLSRKNNEDKNENNTHFFVNAMVWTGKSEASMRQLTADTILSFEQLLPLLVQIQNKNIGRYYGADNPWIWEPPDNHPCMPGIPDDEANILLYLLLLNEFHKDGGSQQ